MINKWFDPFKYHIKDQLFCVILVGQFKISTGKYGKQNTQLLIQLGSVSAHIGKCLVLDKGPVLIESIACGHILKYGLIRLFHMIQFIPVIGQNTGLNHHHAFID